MRTSDTLVARMEIALYEWFVASIKDDFLLDAKFKMENRQELAQLYDTFEKRLRIIRNFWLDPDRSPKMEELLEALKNEMGKTSE